LELEASFNGAKGLRVRGWQSAVFKLSSLPAGSIIRSIDDISVENLDFGDAVVILRDSKKRFIEYWQPQSQQLSRTPLKFLNSDESVSPVGDENMYNISLGSDKKAYLDVSKSPLWGRSPPGNKENIPHNLQLEQPSPLCTSPLAARRAPEHTPNSAFKKTPQGAAPSPRRGLAGSRALQPLGSTPIEPLPPPQIALSRGVAAEAVGPTMSAEASEAQTGPSCKSIASADSVAEEALRAESVAEGARSAPQKLAASVAAERAVTAPGVSDVIPPPEVPNAEEEKQRARKIQQLQAEQRGADAKILLLKFQMGKIKRREQASAAVAKPAAESPPLTIPLKPEMPYVSAASEPAVNTAEASEREALLLHHGKLAAVLAALAGGFAAAAPSADAPSPAKLRDMGMQCSLLVDPPPSQEEGPLRAELAVMERFVQRLKLQLRANIEAQISMHESISRSEIAAHRCAFVEQAPVQVANADSVGSTEADDAASAKDASAIFSGDEGGDCSNSQREEDSVFSHMDEHIDVHSPESPVNVLQSFATNYASPAPAAGNIIQSLAADYASPAGYNTSDEEEVESNGSREVEDEANDSTLADILGAIEKLPARECLETPTERERFVRRNEEAIATPRTNVKQAWTAWVVNEPKPTDMGLSPASFKDHIHRLRGANTLMRDDISRFRETLKRLAEY